jgi:hypothetical protein
MTWWPGWNSIDGAAKWGDIFFWVGFAFLVLLVGCEILSKVYGWRKDTLIATRNNLIAVEADIRTKQADQVLAEAQARQNQARHDAEIAAARPQVEPETTEPQPQPRPPLQPQPQVSPREAEPSGRTPEQVARLQERPRSLTEAQKKIIIALLAPFHGQKFSVVCIAGDPEGRSFAEQIVNVLRGSGWDSPEGGIGEATYNKEPLGVSLMVNAGQIMTPSVLRPVAMLVKALADAGLMQRNGALADPNIPRDRIEIRVGRNRNPP